MSKPFKPKAYDPLNYSTISETMADALISCDLTALGSVGPFYGNGVYALFYTGDFAPYRRLSERNRDAPGSWPIYIGKAAPANRKGGIDPSIVDSEKAGSALFDRSQDHRKSIETVDNLNIDDFQIKLMVCSFLWVPMTETALIARFTPVWNTLLDGFGNHDPGGGRIGGKMSKWDTLHPGREWVEKRRLTPAVSEADLIKAVESELEQVWLRRFKP